MSLTNNTKALEWSYQVLDLKKPTLDEDGLKQGLADYLDYLVRHDFHKLIAILYRIDVSQHKAKMTLAGNTDQKTPGMVLAQLIIDRQKKKLRFRQKYQSP